MYFAFLYVYLILLANYVFSWAKQTYLESSCRDILLPTLASWYSGHHNFHMYQENWKWLTQDVIMPASSINFGKSISWYCSEWHYHETIHWNDIKICHDIVHSSRVGVYWPSPFKATKPISISTGWTWKRGRDFIILKYLLSRSLKN